jgi:hypothetical protein
VTRVTHTCSTRLSSGADTNLSKAREKTDELRYLQGGMRLCLLVVAADSGSRQWQQELGSEARMGIR